MGGKAEEFVIRIECRDREQGMVRRGRTLVSLKIGYAREAKEHRSGPVRVNLNAP